MKKTIAVISAACAVAAVCFAPAAGVTAGAAEAHEKLDLGNYYAFWTDWAGIEEETLASDTTETYAFEDRRWSGLPTVCLTEGGRLWAGFMTGGYGEPDPLNYNAFHYSDDGGKTWSDESLVVEHKNEAQHLYQPHLFMHEGKMQLWLNNAGQNVITIENPDCENPSENLKLSKATKVLSYNAAHRPTILSEKWDNIWLFSAENSASNANAIFASTNGQKWEQYSSVVSTNGSRRWWEAQVVECADGSLIHMSRLESGADGGMQLAYSYDGGETWTDAQANNGRPFTAYSNKSHMQRLDSGNLLLLVGCSTTARQNLTAFLSEDNGRTWPYSLSLDARDHFGDWFGCGYPEAANLQGKNGEIYCVWDARFSYAEIGCAKFTEADIKAGKIVTEGCYSFGSVVRNRTQSGYVYDDIDGVAESFKHTVKVDMGTEAGAVIEKLPQKLTAVYDGQNIPLNGSWVCADYDAERAGRYTFRFQTPDLPQGVSDSFGYLTATVEIGSADGGNALALGLGIGIPCGVLLLGGAAGIAVWQVKKKGKKTDAAEELADGGAKEETDGQENP